MDKNLTSTTRSDLESIRTDYSVDTKTIDEAGAQKEKEYMNEKWTQQLGYWSSVPELNRAITALAIWTAGKGYTTDTATEVLLENITGWGEDTFTSIMINMIKIKKFGRDSYCEVIRNPDTGTLINLKPLNTGKMKHIVNIQGIIERYEYQQANGKFKPYKIEQILHLCNDRIANEIHGTSIADIVEWVILARNEAMRDWKRISHRSSIRVMYVDAEDTTKLKHVKDEYANAIEKGELMLIPAKKGEAEFGELTLPPIDAFLKWIQYLENFFYQAVGVPRVIATSEDYTESGSKVGFLTFEPIYTNEQTQLEADLWNQLAIKVKFNRPPSLGGNLQRDEAKDTGQIGFQPNDTEAGRGE